MSEATLIDQVSELDEFQLNILRFFFAQPEAEFKTTTLAKLMQKNALNPADRRRLEEMSAAGIITFEEEDYGNLKTGRRLYRLHPDLVKFSQFALMSLGQK